jgi:hypothetical protein
VAHWDAGDTVQTFFVNPVDGEEPTPVNPVDANARNISKGKEKEKL